MGDAMNNKVSIAASRRAQGAESPTLSGPSPNVTRELTESPDEALYKLFLEPSQAELPAKRITERFRAAGILSDDPRAKEIFERLEAEKHAQSSLSLGEFIELFALNPSLFRRVAEDSLAIPDWTSCAAPSARSFMKRQK
jgi:glutaminase